MTRDEHAVWMMHRDAIPTPSDRMKLLAVAGMLAIGAVDRVWTLVEDARAWLR